ncbi:MAG: hypothetical protein ACE5L6_08185 [Candidatus Bathyarchaeia archaeon]
MTMISHRECHLVEVKNEDLNRFVEEIKAFLEREKIPQDYTVNVYKDAVACCGYFPIGVFVEIQGPEKQPIEDLDLKIYAKIIEICEREGIEYHECKPLEVLKSGE